MARDQFLESCNRELYVHLKPKTFKNLDEMAKEADLFAEARGGVHTCVNKGQRDNRGAAPSQNKTGASRPSGKPEIKCNICGKGHLTIKCFKHPNRMQVNSAELGSETKQNKGSNSDANNEALGKESDVTLINETTQRFPLAMIDINCPFFTGQTEAICMDDTLYDLVIGNIDGSKLPDNMSHFCAAVETRYQEIEKEKKYRKLKVPDQIINESKAQATDANLENIRRRVEDANMFIGIYIRSQVSVYRTIGPLVFLCFLRCKSI